MGEMSFGNETSADHAVVSVRLPALIEHATPARIKQSKRKRQTEDPEALLEGLRQVLIILGMTHRYEDVVRTLEGYLPQLIASTQAISMTCRARRIGTDPAPA